MERDDDEEDANFLLICQEFTGVMDEVIYTIILLKSVYLSVFFKLQLKILAQSSREISQTVRINCHSFLSRVRISVQPSKFCICKNTQKVSRKLSRPRDCSVGGRRTGDNLNGDTCGHGTSYSGCICFMDRCHNVSFNVIVSFVFPCTRHSMPVHVDS